MKDQPLIPTTPALDKRTYSSPMSYIGATRRITRFIKEFGDTPLKAALAWTGGAVAILAMVFVVTLWYFVTVFIFGLYTIPYRLIRRSSRKNLHIQGAQLATMQQMMLSQQATMIQNQESNARLSAQPAHEELQSSGAANTIERAGTNTLSELPQSQTGQANKPPPTKPEGSLWVLWAVDTKRIRSREAGSWRDRFDKDPIGTMDAIKALPLREAS
jgi:hypothetical protein